MNQPLDIPPNTEFRYRNSDPLTLGRIIRQTVEARGEDYLTFPQRAPFDRIGMRNVVLETDIYGNFIMTGYDYLSAHDWARFGLWLNARGALPDVPRDAFWAAGFMGQDTVVIPSLDMVVVRLGPSPGESNRYLNQVIAGVTAALEPRH